jgi:hypothetical protein
MLDAMLDAMLRAMLDAMNCVTNSAAQVSSRGPELKGNKKAHYQGQRARSAPDSDNSEILQRRDDPPGWCHHHPQEFVAL